MTINQAIQRLVELREKHGERCFVRREDTRTTACFPTPFQLLDR